MAKNNPFLQSLTPEQETAVLATEGRIRVVAGAGSGKTRTLVHRYAYLMGALGIPQSDILCMTFTNKAAREMKTRISAMTPGGAIGDFVTTIHGFCVKFLRKEIFRLGYPENFLIFDEEDMKGLIKEVLEENGIDRRKGTVDNYMEELGAFKATTPYISRYVLPESTETPESAPLIGKMILRQKRYFALDFDDPLNFTLHILNNFPEVRARWQNQFQYVMVDEVQDCSFQEWELFTILSEQYGSLFVVGDGDQAFGDKVRITAIVTGLKLDLSALDKKDLDNVVVIDKDYVWDTPSGYDEAPPEAAPVHVRIDFDSASTRHHDYHGEKKPDLCVQPGQKVADLEMVTAIRRKQPSGFHSSN